MAAQYLGLHHLPGGTGCEGREGQAPLAPPLTVDEEGPRNVPSQDLVTFRATCRLACLNPIEQPEGLARVPQSLWDQEWEAEEEDGREAEMTLSLLFTPGAPSLLSGPGVQAPYSGQVGAAGSDPQDQHTARGGRPPVLPGTLGNSSVVSATHYQRLPTRGF